MANTSLYNTCNPKDPNYFQQLLFNAYNIVNEDIMNLINKGYKEDQRGKKIADYTWDSVNDINYLILYLFILNDKIIREGSLTGEVSESFREELREEYKIDCIKKYFFCKNININPLLELFAVNTDGGIDYMSIETGNNPFITT